MEFPTFNCSENGVQFLDRGRHVPHQGTCLASPRPYGAVPDGSAGESSSVLKSRAHLSEFPRSGEEPHGFQALSREDPP